ncbi:hypothetical protein D8M30_16525, partial [Corynebacterium pseudodiphtheriticum]
MLDDALSIFSLDLLSHPVNLQVLIPPPTKLNMACQALGRNSVGGEVLGLLTKRVGVRGPTPAPSADWWGGEVFQRGPEGWFLEGMVWGPVTL